MILLTIVLSSLITVLHVTSFQMNLQSTEWFHIDEKNANFKHHCIYVSMSTDFESLPAFLKVPDNPRNFRQVTSFCLSESPFIWSIGENREHQKFSFSDLAALNVTSEQLYRWSSSIDMIESYQFFLDNLITSDNVSAENKFFFNCTPPWFGPQCQYSIPSELEGDFSSFYEFIHTVYALVEYKPTELSCYQHLKCDLGSTLLCLDWSNICDGLVQCIDGIDEKHCWQMDINQCKEDEYRCRNGQCIPLVFFDDHLLAAECLDQSDRKDIRDINPSIYELYEFRRPTFLNEETILFNDTSYVRPYSFLPNRRYSYVRLMASHSENSAYDTCLSALYCHLSFFGFDKIGCTKRCPIPNVKKCPWPQIINGTCFTSEIFYAPIMPIVFGHIYLAYSKQYLVQQTTWTNTPEYICYNEQLCNNFPSEQNVISFNKTVCRRVQDVLPRVIVNGDGIGMISDYIRQISVHLYKCNTMSQNENTFCDNQTMYQCFNSTKCIAKIRIFDLYQDCDYGDDEDTTRNALIDELCLEKTSPMHFKCPITNRCISRKLLRNSQCDCGYSDSDNFVCPDEDIGMKSIREHISFPTICNSFNDIDAVLIDGQSYTDETECEHWLCNNTYTRCNGYWDCNDGADEVDCYSLLSNLNCTRHSFLCVSPHTRNFICLPMDRGNDGTVDCLGGTDEPRLCRHSNIRAYDYGFFCHDRITLSSTCIERTQLCTTYAVNQCANYEMRKFCQIDFSDNLFRSDLCDRDDSSFLSDIEEKICYLFRFTPKPQMIHFSLGQSKSSYEDRKENQTSPSSSIIKVNESIVLNCHRGIPLKVALNVDNGSYRTTCLCLPNYYGDKCQYQNQRVSFTMKLRTFSDSWQTQFNLVITLIDNSYERVIHSYEQLTYFPIQHCQTNYDIYLLYSDLTKNESKQYSIHIDVYEKLSLDYRGSLLVDVPFLFLPIQRIASSLSIPYKNYNMKMCSMNGCKHGECIQYFNHPQRKTFCRCYKEWTGRLCTIPYQCSCSSDAICHGVSANNRSICICQAHKWGPRCLMTDHICHSSNPCKNGGTCISYDQHVSPGKTFVCICKTGFYGKRCELSSYKVTISFSKEIVLPAVMFIHFIEVKTKQAPERGITFKKIPINRDAVTIYWSQPFHISFLELFTNRYYLIVQDKNYDQYNSIKKEIKSSDYCPHILELFNETFAKLHLVRRIKYFHVPCQNRSRELSCFYDDDYFCLCILFNNQRQANCFEFNHTLKRDCSGRSICENGGQCLQDSLTCPQISTCICPSCFYGSQCQFTSDGHSLSLDAILGYHIQPSIPMNYQPAIVRISLVLTIITTVVGLVNGILSIITFVRIDWNGTGCGLYLLGSSITTLVTTIIFLIKFIILMTAQMTYVTNRWFLQFQCISIDYIMRIALNMDQWLNACIAMERAALIIKGVRFNRKASIRIAKWVIISLLIVAIITNIIDPMHRRLVDENSNDEKRIWCTLTYTSTIQQYHLIMNILHFGLPFIINIISASIIIVSSARLKSSTQANQTYKQQLIEQCKQHGHLLMSSFLLCILAIPRLVIVFSRGCMKTTADSWWFLMGYFISIFPPMLNFVIFVVPSKAYKHQFRTTMLNYRQALGRRLRFSR